MNNPKLVIENIIQLVEATIPERTDEVKLEYQLTVLYKACLEIDNNFDKKDYPDPPDFEYKIIRGQVIDNLPKLWYYNSVLNLTEDLGNPEFGTGDAVDDLSDIIKDLK